MLSCVWLLYRHLISLEFRLLVWQNKSWCDEHLSHFIDKTAVIYLKTFPCDHDNNARFGTKYVIYNIPTAGTRDAACSCVHKWWRYFKLPNECLLTTAHTLKFDLLQSDHCRDTEVTYSATWVSLHLTQVLLHSSRCFARVHNDASMPLYSSWTKQRNMYKYFFYTQRKAVTEHRYLTCLNPISIQWEQGTVMYCYITCLQSRRKWMEEIDLPKVYEFP